MRACHTYGHHQAPTCLAQMLRALALFHTLRRLALHYQVISLMHPINLEATSNPLVINATMPQINAVHHEC